MDETRMPGSGVVAEEESLLIADDLEATTYQKSRRNRATEREALSVLLRDERFQTVDLHTKRAILEAFGAKDFSPQAFDAVMTPHPADAPITVANLDTYLASLRLIEMKATRKLVRNRALNGFFFGATEREYALADLLGDRYLFAFVVLSENNDYRSPFAVLLTVDELNARSRNRRVQYQVNLRSDMLDEPTRFGLVLATPAAPPSSGAQRD